MTPLPCPCGARRWGHGKPTGWPPVETLTDAEAIGRARPPAWPTPLHCLSCGRVWRPGMGT